MTAAKSPPPMPESQADRRTREFREEAYRVWSAASYLSSVADGPLVRLACRWTARRYARRIEILTAAEGAFIAYVRDQTGRC